MHRQRNVLRKRRRQDKSKRSPAAREDVAAVTTRQTKRGKPKLADWAWWLVKHVQIPFMNKNKRPTSTTTTTPPVQRRATPVKPFFTPIPTNSNTTTTYEQEMTAHPPTQPFAPSENWDDDFEFHSNHDLHDHSTRPRLGTQASGDSFDTRWSTSNSGITTADDKMDVSSSSPPRRSNRAPLQPISITQSLRDWSDPSAGPSNISHAPRPPQSRSPKSTLFATTVDPLRSWSESPVKAVASEAENWDDDFEDRVDSPARRSYLHSAVSTPSKLRGATHDTWDEDFEMGHAETSPTTSPGKRTRKDTSWDSSDEDMASDDDVAFGARNPCGSEEDHTVTARNHRIRPSSPSTPPPLPAFPPLHLRMDTSSSDPSAPAPFPRSPTASAFSIPASSFGGRESTVYSSTAYLALRPTKSTGSSALIESPPPQTQQRERERRRLRKKSRPPHLDGNILELEDRTTTTSDPPPQPGSSFTIPIDDTLTRMSTPDSRPTTPPPISSPMTADPISPASPNSSNKTPLLSRIGSVKRWGVRRGKRTSDVPSNYVSPDTTLDQTPRTDAISTPAASTPSSPMKTGTGRFFRGHGGAGPGPGPGSPPSLKKEQSRDRLRILSGWGSSSSSPQQQQDDDGDVSMDGSIRGTRASGRLAKQRPSSMQVAPGQVLRPINVPRHASGPAGRGKPNLPSGTPPTIGRSFSASHAMQASSSNVEEPANEESGAGTGTDGGEKEKVDGTGKRRFMGGVRRISLGHRRTKSGGGNDGADGVHPPPVPPVPDSPQKSASGAPQLTSPALLPPIELALSPPSPERSRLRRKAELDVFNASPMAIDLSIRASLDNPPPPQPSSSTSPTTATASPSASGTGSTRTSPTKLPVPSQGSPQSASLGRSTPTTHVVGMSAIRAGVEGVPRRNSLGDLKIPSRISRAQDGLKKDLSRVREFAACVELMKELRSTYFKLVAQLQTVLDIPEAPSRATSPTFFNRGITRSRSNTNPTPPPPRPNHTQLASAFRTLDAKYKVTWECADLLMELGGGAVAASASANTSPADASMPNSPMPHTSTSAPVVLTSGHGQGTPKNPRERAITLAGDEGKPPLIIRAPQTTSPPQASPPTAAWRASTGRHDLNHRQLFLLKEMLQNSDSAMTIPVEMEVEMEMEKEAPEEAVAVATKHWKWGEGMDSTITLPSEESAVASSSVQATTSPGKQRHKSRLGMTGFRDLLRSLKSKSARGSKAKQGSTSNPAAASADSSINDPSYGPENLPPPPPIPHPRKTVRKRAKTSIGPESVRSTANHPNNPYMSRTSLPYKSSPRRPSLASLFRLGQKSKTSSITGTEQSSEAAIDAQRPADGSAHSRDTTEDEDYSDWDRMESSADLNAAVAATEVKEGTGTLRGKKQPAPRPESVADTRAITPPHPPDESETSLIDSQSPDTSFAGSGFQLRTTRLSNVDEDGQGDVGRASKLAQFPSPRRPQSRGKNAASSSTVRSVAPVSLDAPFDIAMLPNLKLAMTPENIKPLLENAREVTSRLKTCINEFQEVMANT